MSHNDHMLLREKQIKNVHFKQVQGYNFTKGIYALPCGTQWLLKHTSRLVCACLAFSFQYLMRAFIYCFFLRINEDLLIKGGKPVLLGLFTLKIYQTHTRTPFDIVFEKTFLPFEIMIFTT